MTLDARSEIVVLVGIPGSGKTAIARKLYPDYTRVSLDVLGSRGNERKEIQRALEAQEKIIIDNTNTTKKTRRRYLEYAERYKVPISAVFVKCPLDIAIERNATRFGQEYVPERAVKMYFGILEQVDVEEGFESVKVIENY
jgi:predicted kinase